MTNKAMINRSEWVSALKAIPTSELLELTTELSQDWVLQPKSIPQSGLGMMKLKDSALNETFYLGEIPLSTAWLQVTTADGVKAEGAANVMGDRVEVAEALALCDAILSSQLPGWEMVHERVEQGISIRKSIHDERKMILARTQVDFSLLDNAGDENAQT